MNDFPGSYHNKAAVAFAFAPTGIRKSIVGWTRAATPPLGTKDMIPWVPSPWNKDVSWICKTTPLDRHREPFSGRHLIPSLAHDLRFASSGGFLLPLSENSLTSMSSNNEEEP